VDRRKYIIIPVLQWYSQNKRNLPWRRTVSPYRILVSEVMLQQTQVDRVISKYRDFLRQFPSIKKLATASAGDVITAWQGLGYNRRALYLQKTATTLRKEYGGRFPQDLASLKQLPGIGDYTARALLSFAFDKPVAMLDTNHRKFYSRLFHQDGVSSDLDLLEKTQELLEEILVTPTLFCDGKSMVYHWNQALMDFGALFLVRGADLSKCPIRDFSAHVPEFLGEKKKKNTIPFRQTDRYYRGRIVDLLRKKKSMKTRDMAQMFADMPKSRQQSIIQGLIRDGLIKKVGYSMLLP